MGDFQRSFHLLEDTARNTARKDSIEAVNRYFYCCIRPEGLFIVICGHIGSLSQASRHPILHILATSMQLSATEKFT